MANQQPEHIWFNGAVMPWQDAQVHVLTHALHYGSSVFEGIRAYATHEGTQVFRLTDHINRLYDSARIYRMDIPYSREQIIEACKDIVRVNKLQHAYIRPLVFLGYGGGLGIVPKEETPVEVTIAAFEWGAYLGQNTHEIGVDVGVSSWNRLAQNTMPTAAKAGGNYLSSALIAREARRHGYQEGLALDTNGYVSEGAGQNVFLVKNRVLYTPPTSASILPGLTRATVVTLAQHMGYQVIEAPIARDALYLADEIFLVGTATEIVPVKTIDGLVVGKGKRGPVTALLQQQFFGLFTGQTQDLWGWLEPVHTLQDEVQPVDTTIQDCVHAAYA